MPCLYSLTLDLHSPDDLGVRLGYSFYFNILSFYSVNPAKKTLYFHSPELKFVFLQIASKVIIGQQTQISM